MNYESMIDNLNMDYRFFLQECSLESIPYAVMNEGAIIDLIKKIFGAIIDFFKGIVNFVKDLFGKNKDTEEVLKDNDNKIFKITTKKMQYDPQTGNFEEVDENKKITIKYFSTFDFSIQSVDQGFSESILSNYIDILLNSEEYIKNGKNKPQSFEEFYMNDGYISTRNKYNSIKSNKKIELKDTDIYYKKNPNELRQDLQKKNDYLKKLNKAFEADDKRALDLASKGINAAKKLESKFKEAADKDSSVNERLSYISTQFNLLNKEISLELKAIADTKKNIDISAKSINAALDRLK